MKFMKLGTQPDTFYTEAATRTLISDVPSDLTIQVNNIIYLLHKYPLLPKCGLLQLLCSESDAEDSSNIAVELHDIPGGEEAFELCAKFCYGITINLSAHNFVPAFCAANFLQMTEAVEKVNFVTRLEVFFSSCILEGWKDSIVTVQNTGRLYKWSENLGIVRRCIESIVEKILTPPAKVKWSYTYTRPGYEKRRHQSVPKDWWTEDISFLDIDMFRCILAAIRSTNMLPPQLVGEVLHVYMCRWIPDITKGTPTESSTSQAEISLDKKQRIIETIVSLIPVDKGSVSIGFLIRLLALANFLGTSPVTKAELTRRSGMQFEEATLNDLLLPAQSSNGRSSSHDIDLVMTILESFLRHWKRQTHTDENQPLRLIRKAGKLIDSYLQVVAKDANTPVQKVVSLAEALPRIARPEHDDLYKAINIFLKEHPDITKADKKQLCRVLDCQKLSPEVCAHAVKNERLPLRTVVQVLFFEQEKSNRASSKQFPSPEQFQGRQQTPVIGEEISRLTLSADEKSSKAKGNRSSMPSTSGLHQKSDGKLQLKPEPSLKIRGTGIEMVKVKDIMEEESQGSPRSLHEKAQARRVSEQRYSKGRER